MEAARAGVHGDGFAVVAKEVRHLAQRCAKAAEDTNSVVNETMDRSTKGQVQLKRVIADMQGVSQDGVRIRMLVEEMQIGCREQSRGIGQIDKAITELEHVTQSSAAQAEEGAASSAELSLQAQLMNELVADLKVLVEGAQAPAFVGRTRTERTHPASSTARDGQGAAHGSSRHRV